MIDLASSEFPPLSVFVVGLCAFGSVIAATLAVGFGSTAPDWVHNVYYSVLIANSAVLVLFWHYQWRLECPVSTVVTAVGIYNIFAWDLLRIFSHLGPDFHPGRIVFWLLIPGLFMGTIGIWFVDVHSYRLIVDDIRIGLVGVLGIIGLITAVQAFTVGFSLVGFVWAQGTGSYLIPIIGIGGIRWWLDTGRIGELIIGITVIGILIVLISPTWRYDQISTMAYCFGDNWASSLRYSIGGSPLEVSWSDGCNGHSFKLDKQPMLMGFAVTLVGAVGWGMISLRER